MRTLGFLLVAAIAGTAAPARADETRSAGVQAAPPRPDAPDRAPLDQDGGGRRAVRGCPNGQTCVRVEDEGRAFELETFGPGNPWVEREHSPSAPRGGDRATRPTDLRPDLPWLADLAMPDLPVRWDDRLISYLLYYKEDPRGRATMKHWLARQGRYRDLIVDRLRRAHLPEDLQYIAMIESSYDPTVVSYAGAGGLWQLMPDGGRIYGLHRDRWVDERQDPVRATEGVVDYWADLFQRFGDWPLAIAAYNSGYGAVLRAVARYNTNDFWQLTRYENALPWDTALYVPKLLAVAIIGHNRERFGFGDVKDVAGERWDDVKVPTSVSLAVVARAAGCTAEDVRRLNPQLRRGRTPPRPDFIVRVPAGGGASFARRFADLRPDWDGYDAYVVAYGERFEDVATQFGISVRKLRELNEVDHESEVAGGTLLVVPRISDDARRANLARAMESLYASGVDQRPGEPLLVPVPDADAAIDGKRRVFYRVVTGDTVAGVARALGVSVADLASWNDIDGDAKLHPRMVVQAWVAPGFDGERARVRLLDDSRILVVTRGSKAHLDVAEARVGRERVEYTPERRESLEQIGKKFGLGPRDLGRINRMNHTAVIEPGQTIVVYRVVDRKRSDRAAEQWKKAPRGERGQKKKRDGDGQEEARDDDKAAADADARARPDRPDRGAEDADQDDVAGDGGIADRPPSDGGDEDVPVRRRGDARKEDDDKAKAKKTAARDDDAAAAKADDKKADAKKADAKKADDKQPAAKPDAKKADDKKPAAKKADGDKQPAAKPDAKPDGDSKPAAGSDADKPPDDKKADPARAPRAGRRDDGPVSHPDQLN